MINTLAKYPDLIEQAKREVRSSFGEGRISLQQFKSIAQGKESGEGSSLALVLAIMGGYSNIVKDLIEEGVDIDERMNGYTPLMIAVISGEYSLAKLLLDSNADPNIRVHDGYTALVLAVITRQINLINLLVKYQADLNQVTNDGCTVLMIATAMRNKNIVQTLVQRGANRSIRNYYGHSALDLALRRGFDEIASIIEKGRLSKIHLMYQSFVYPVIGVVLGKCCKPILNFLNFKPKAVFSPRVNSPCAIPDSSDKVYAPGPPKSSLDEEFSLRRRVARKSF